MSDLGLAQIAEMHKHRMKITKIEVFIFLLTRPYNSKFQLILTKKKLLCNQFIFLKACLLQISFYILTYLDSLV